MTGTQTKQGAGVCSVQPLVSDKGAKVVEMWSTYRVDYMIGESIGGCLQPNQYLPLAAKGSALAECTISVQSAKVFSGRYLVASGSDKVVSHPKVQDYQDGVAPRGKGAELLFPGGVRTVRLNPLLPFIGAAEDTQFSNFKTTATSFHKEVAEFEVVDGAVPLTLAVVSDVVVPGASYAVAYNVMTDSALTVQVVPIPTILSAPERKVVTEQDFVRWPKAIQQFLDLHQVQEYGIMYKGDGDDVLEDRIYDQPALVHRAPLAQDYGYGSLDSFDTFEWLMPFQGGQYRP